MSDLLDKHRSLSGRLFREHCVFHRGNYVKVSMPREQVVGGAGGLGKVWTESGWGRRD